MKNKSCVWLVCALLCIATVGKAQVVTLENGVGITSLRAGDGSTDNVYPYHMSLGYQYLDKGWFNLSSSIGYLRKGGQIKAVYNPISGDLSNVIFKSKLHYLTINTTFDVKKTSPDGYTFFVGVGPWIDFKLKATEESYVESGSDPDYPAQKSTIKGVHPLQFGLKCVGGIRKDFGNMQLGINIAYLPTFTRVISGGGHDRTFTFGLSLGYRLGGNNDKAETIRSVRRHK